jgi:phytoene dehydrogenase-like protein
VGEPDAIEWINVKNSFFQVGDEVKKYTKKAMVEAAAPDQQKNFEKLFDEVLFITDEELEKLWYVPLEEWVSRFTSDPMAHAIIDGLVCQYFCVPGSVASTTEWIKTFKENIRLRSSGLPKGGNMAISKGFASIVEKHGGVIRLNSKVDTVIVRDNATAGVRLKDGSELYAPVIVSNADLKTTVLKLVGSSHFPEDYVDMVNNLTYAVQPVTLKVVLKEQVTDKQLVIYMPDTQSPTLKVTEEMQAGVIPEWIGGFYTSTTNFDPSLAPGGEQFIGTLQACPPGFHQDWNKWKEVLLNNFYRVFPEARGKLVKAWLETPGAVDRFAGEEGNIIGVGQTVDQIHERRPKVVSPLEGLYFSSGEAGGHGIGTEMAARSAMEVFKELTK